MKDKLSDLPIYVWNPLLEVMTLAQKESCIKRVVDNESTDLLEYIDTFTNNDFFYKIIGYGFSNEGKSNSKLYYEIDKKPSDSDGSKKIFHYNLTESFSRWVTFIRKYQHVALIEDEELINNYGEEFFKEMDDDEIDDDNDEYLNIDAQIRVDSLLQAIEDKLIKIGLDNDDPYIESIKEEVSILRDTQSKYKKKELKKYIARILAKIRSLSVKLLKEFWDTSKKEIYKRIINGKLDDIAGYLDNF